MDRTRFSHIAHRGLALCNPAGSARVDRAIELLELPRGAAALDIGAGKCEWLARIAERWGARGTAIEPAGVFAAEARELQAATIAAGLLEIIEAPAAAYLASGAHARFDAVLCIGASHALGGYGPALDALIACTAPGGRMVFGEGYWKKTPDAAYLRALGGDESDLTSHAGNIRAAIERGCTPVWCTAVTDDECDEYEWAYSRNVEEFVREHPDDPDAAAMLARSRAWRDTVMNGGRETLGFGLYVFRAPG
jgi:SAM-dependent methyltransferase